MSANPDFRYDVFLSHSSKDKAVVLPLAERLRADGLKVWFDEWEIKPGDCIPTKTEEGLEHSRVLVLCMSANAFGSDWAQLEAGTFRFRDPLNRERRFIPLRLDDAPIHDSLLERPYVDWRPDVRKARYAKLLELCRPLSTYRLRTCDIVMKGGITSGVVYPLAIVRLSRRFVFRNIGGTSAGAIAAAAAAAAEFRRQRNSDPAAFDPLRKLPELLIQQPDASGRTRLFQFFQPDDRTRRLFEVLTSGMKGRGLPRAFWNALKKYAVVSGAGAAPGLALACVSYHCASGPMSGLWICVSALLALAGALAGASAGILREAIREIPRHGFGLCSGMSATPYDGGACAPATALTVWLTGYLNETAGLPPNGDPLTFGQLWRADNREPSSPERCVNLEMMTTNLTHRRPFRLPFRDDEDLKENAQFFFREDEFRRYFPAHVVQWIRDHPRVADDDNRTQGLLRRLKDRGYLPLPAPEDLPVVVATRMSLSFPFLLCAVPLHAIDWSLARGPDDARQRVLPERCWFSDGGICSNFPLHFFDSALPRRPTFSIDLAEQPADTPDANLHPQMVRNNSARISERWSRFDTEPPKGPGVPPEEKPDWQKLAGFIWAMIGTMQNWTDTTQARLPGYRDRIVSVPLKPDEGGLNLNMPQELITRLSERGAEAAMLIEEHFDAPPLEQTMTWDNHRWIRLRSMLAAFEKTLNQIVAALDHPENGDLAYGDWVEQIENGHAHAPCYKMQKAQLAAARLTLDQLRGIQGIWNTTTAAAGSPRPRPVLRPRPQI